MMLRTTFAVLLIGWCVPHPIAAQTTDIERFLVEVRAGTAAYQNVDNAIRDGFRPIGPDAPAMGRHWVNIGRVLDGRFDVRRPAVLTYIEVDGRLTLAGVAFALPLTPGEPPPGPFPHQAWHIHAGDVAEEGALFGHDMTPSTHAEKRGVGVLHVWAWTDNPAGAVAADNWVLPFVRRGLDPPQTDPHQLRDAALALALPDGGAEFLLDVLRRNHLHAAADQAHAENVLLRHAVRIERSLQRSGIPGPRALAEAWLVCWSELRNGLTPAGRRSIDALRVLRNHT